MTKLFAFHRQYVLDVDTLAEGVTEPEERKKKLRKELTKVSNKAGTPLEVRMLTDRNISYVVPAATFRKNPDSDGKRVKVPSVTLKLTRAVVLNAVDNWIGLQETENERIRAKKRSDSCCP
jgi:hypothetical protein